MILEKVKQLRYILRSLVHAALQVKLIFLYKKNIQEIQMCVFLNQSWTQNMMYITWYFLKYR